MRLVTVAGLLLLAASASKAVATPIDVTVEDPVFFCDSSQGYDPNGCGGHPNLIGSATSFEMFKNGNGLSDTPWYLLVAIPDYVGAAPTITSDGSVFAQQGSATSKTFLSSSSGDIYGLFGLTGDNSMNATNMFGAAEQAAFGGTPTSFTVFEYTFTPEFNSGAAYTFTVGGSGLISGTFLAASGGSNPFSTPFTTAGLVVPDTGNTLVLLGGALLGLAALRRRLPA
jgi:hypothetical protein